MSMTPTQYGYGDSQTWGGRSFDDEWSQYLAKGSSGCDCDDDWWENVDRDYDYWQIAQEKY